MDNPNSNEPKQRRHRVSKACDACRKKKVKCDGETPVCQNCIHSLLKCTYLDATKKRGPPRGYIEAIESRLHRLESLLGGLIQSEDPHAQALLQSLVNDDIKVPKQTRAERLAAWRNSPLSRETESMDQSSDDDPESGAARSKQRLSPITKTASVSDSASPEGPLDLSDVMGQLQVDKNQEVHYFGKTPTSFVLKNSRLYREGSVSIDPEMWPHQTPANNVYSKVEDWRQDILEPERWMPSQELSDHLLDTYFLHFHPQCPVVYKPAFKRPIVGQELTCSPVLLSAMYSIACLYTDRTDVRTIPDHPATAGEEFFRRSKEMIRVLGDGTASVALVQATIIIAIREQGCGRPESSWIYVGLAIRIGQSLGVHRDCTKWNLSTKKLTHEEKESRKRVFWVMLVSDRYIAASLGRPMAIDDRDFDTTPANEDEADEHELLDGPPFSQQDGPAPVKSSSGRKVHAISCMNKLVQLAEIIGRIVRSIYAYKLRVVTISSEAVLSVLDSALKSWYASLPEHMRYAPNAGRIRASQVVKLHTMYYTALILLHRPFAVEPRPGEERSSKQSSLSTCTHAAMTICNIIQVHGQEHSLDRFPPNMINPLIQAASIHLYNATHGDAQTMLEAKLNYLKCKQILAEMQSSLSGAKRALDVLEGAIDLSDIERNTSVPLASSNSAVAAKTSTSSSQAATGPKSPAPVDTLSPPQTYSYLFPAAAPATLVHPTTSQVLPNGQFDPADYIDMPFLPTRLDPYAMVQAPYPNMHNFNPHGYGMATSTNSRDTMQSAMPMTQMSMQSLNTLSQAQMQPQMPPQMHSQVQSQVQSQIQSQSQLQPQMQPNMQYTVTWSGPPQDNREMIEWSNYLQSQIVAARTWADHQRQRQDQDQNENQNQG